MIRQIAEAIRSNHRFLVVSHANPDGDAVGSSLSLYLFLREMGKDVTVYNEDDIPSLYAFLPGTDKLVTELSAEERYDVTIALDCANIDRLGRHFPDRKRCGKLIFIDHHLSRGDEADIYYSDSDSPAVGELLFELFKFLNHSISREIADNLYVALLTDTGSFRYSNTTPRAMRCAAELLERGTNAWEISSRIYETQPRGKLQLLARVLATLELTEDGQCASLVATQSMIAETGSSSEMLDGFINYARSIEGVEVAVLFKELNHSSYKVSFRSRGKYNVAEIAAKFHGGGHHNAAGCRLSGELGQIREKIHGAVSRTLSS